MRYLIQLIIGTLIGVLLFDLALSAQEAAATPEEAIAWSQAIGQIFDAWWERILLIVSLLGNLGLLTKSGRQGLKQAATLGQQKPQ
jgi:hypothetical protein